MGHEAHRAFWWQRHVTRHGLSCVPVQREQGADCPCAMVCAVRCVSVQASA